MEMYHLKDIPSETQIKKFLKKILFGQHIFCPACKRHDVLCRQNRYWCRKCRMRFSLLSHTWLSNMRLPLKQFWLVLFSWTNQIPVKQTQALSGLSEKAVRFWFDSFRNHLPQNQEVLEAMVQLDEAYFGRFGSIALFLGKQIGTRKLAYQILTNDSPGKLDAINFLRNKVKPETKLATDGSVIYQGIDRYFPVDHVFDIHKKFEFTNTSEIEGMFGVLRTFIRRMYHHVTVKKFPEYMCEFYYRFCRPEMFRSPYHYLLNTLCLVPTG